MSRKRKPTITQLIMKQVNENLKDIKYDKTKKQYVNHAKRFVAFCRTNFDCRTFDECIPHIQEYVDYLKAQGYTPSTVHTHAVAITQAFRYPLKLVKKDKRKVSEYTRGRGVDITKEKPTKSDLFDPKWETLVAFQRKTGLRRNDLYNLCGRNLKYDESQNLSIEIEKSKGGKYQLQRILHEDEDFIRSYFKSIGPDERVFQKELFNNNLNLHYFRAEHAKECYEYYYEKTRRDPDFRKVMEQELRLRWQKYNIDKRTGKPKKFNEKLIAGNYYLRGDTKKMAIEKGLRTKYEKLIVLYISTFFLSHWRLGVCVHSYLLA